MMAGLDYQGLSSCHVSFRKIEISTLLIMDLKEEMAEKDVTVEASAVGNCLSIQDLTKARR